MPCQFGKQTALPFNNSVSHALSEGTQPEFPFPNSGDPPGTPTDSKKQTFHLYSNIFKKESVERTHLYNYVFH